MYCTVPVVVHTDKYSFVHYSNSLSIGCSWSVMVQYYDIGGNIHVAIWFGLPCVHVGRQVCGCGGCM